MPHTAGDVAHRPYGRIAVPDNPPLIGRSPAAGDERALSCLPAASSRKSLSLSFNLLPVGWRVCFVAVAGFLGYRVAGCRAAGGAFGPAGTGPGGFSDTGGAAQAGPDVRKPAADPAGWQGSGRVGPPFPGAAQVGGERAGEQQLGERGHDQADPPVGLLGSADPGGG